MAPVAPVGPIEPVDPVDPVNAVGPTNPVSDIQYAPPVPSVTRNCIGGYLVLDGPRAKIFRNVIASASINGMFLDIFLY
jgi:hypothetical protein